MSTTLLRTAPHVDLEPTDTSPSVLVVDDEPEIREMIAELLIHDGLQVQMAAGGAEALAMLAEAPPPAAIVLDLMMPVVSGLHVLAAMRNREALRRVACIIVSAMPVPEHVAADPLNRILQKPFNADRLIAATHEAVRSWRRP